MKLCLLFHCICQNYAEIPSFGQGLFVSLNDVETLIQQLQQRGYKFAGLEDPSPNTVTLTFDDGYYNNLCFGPLSQAYQIPYLLLVSTHYTQSGDCFPWFLDKGENYDQMHLFDYYQNYSDLYKKSGPGSTPDIIRPMNFQELSSLAEEPLVEIGCHGHYHQALSKNFEGRVQQESSLSLAALKNNLGIEPRYFGLANGIYTRRVVRQLRQSFDRMLTSDGRPFGPRDRVIHRLNLANPNLSGPLMQQIDRHLELTRQVKRAFRTARKQWL